MKDKKPIKNNLDWFKRQKTLAKISIVIIFTVLTFVMFQFLSVVIINFSRQNQSEEDQATYTALSNEGNLSEYYNVVYPYKEGGSRMLMDTYLDSSFDLETIENGLFQISQEVFSTKDYYYQEGQVIAQTDIEYLLGNDMSDADFAKVKEKDENAKNIGINPIKGYEMTLANGDTVQPTKLCSYVYEQDYVSIDENGYVKIEGMSVALMMEPSITYTKDGKSVTYYYTVDELKANAEFVIQNLNNYFIGQGIDSTMPILYAIYLPATDTDSDKQNEYIAFTETTAAPVEESKLQWTDINSTKLIYLSPEAREYDQEVYNSFETFATSVNEFSDSYIAVSGEGLGVDGVVQELEISIYITSTNASEIAGFTQYVENLAKDAFPGIDTYITINNPSGTASYISIEGNDAQKIVLK